MTDDIAHSYQLDECLKWIIHNKYTRLVLQFNNGELSNSVAIVTYLREAYEKRREPSGSVHLDLYVSQSNTCSVDLIVTQHVSNVDAIIHFGVVCHSKPHLQNQEAEKPILLVYGHIVNSTYDIDVEEILTQIKTVARDESKGPICILYDSNLVDYAKSICDKLTGESLNKSVEVSKLILPSENWHTTPSHQSLTTRKTSYFLGQYGISRPIDHYKSMIYLGNRLSIKTTLEGPSTQWRIDCYDYLEIGKVNVSRVLNKRMALVDRLRDDEELKIGVIITNPLPNISEAMKQLESYARARKHTLYFISMIQTIDECKIGNFDLCDAFVVINSCTCSTILESLCFNRPIINDLEFKLACGFEATYGRVLWPCSDSHLSADDLMNKRKVSDVSLALIQSRNEILERCSTARTKKWSGLDYKAKAGGGGGDGGDEDTSNEGASESLAIREGLSGIASSYASEPLKKPVCGDGGGSQRASYDDGADDGNRMPTTSCSDIKK